MPVKIVKGKKMHRVGGKLKRVKRKKKKSGY